MLQAPNIAMRPHGGGKKSDYFISLCSVVARLLGDSGAHRDSRGTIRGSTAAATVVVHPPPLKPAMMRCSLAEVARN